MAAARHLIRFFRRGRMIELPDVPPSATLLDWLRLQDGSKGTKEGCAEGDCGACTVALGRQNGGRMVYEPINACIHLLGMIDGTEVVTVEDLAADGKLHPVQQAMVDHHASQCGFCTPGFVMALFTLYHRAERRPVRRATVNDWLAGNLCRCTGYRPIIDAALDACSNSAADQFCARAEQTARRLAEIDDDADVFIGSGSEFVAAPRSIESLARLYCEHPDASLVAGATDVGLWITKGLRLLPKIIFLKRVRGLDESVETEREWIFGAATAHATAMDHLASIDPDLRELWRRFGSEQIRAAGTIGGNIANGSPIGDAAPALIALGSTLELQRSDAVRMLPLESFFLAYGRQDRQPGEFIRRIRVSKLDASSVFRCYKVSKRIDEDITAVLGAFRFRLDGRRVAEARVAYGGMAATPRRAEAVERELAGLSLDDPDEWTRAVSACQLDYQPIDDHRATARYRMRVAANLLAKALAEVAGSRSTATRVRGVREDSLATVA